MKKIFISLLISILIITGNVGVSSALTEETRAVWLTTAWGLDWPKNQTSSSKQKSEMINLLDEFKSIGINTIMFQVRPMADALYESEINPWSSVLTGVQGKAPDYDPLKFVTEEAHKRGIEVHAWLNPYRVISSGTDLSKLSADHPARLNPSMTMEYNNAVYYNPELPEVKKHIADTVAEIVNNYSVDGVVFDDYFYPEKYPLPNGESKDGAVANARRNHINEMVKLVSDTINSIKPNVKFGISPSGIWKNKYSDPTGSDTNGNESYYSVFADTRTWIKNGWVDYVSPQIYWPIGYKIADYAKLIEWWSNEVRGTNVDLLISHTLEKSDTAVEIDKQLELNKSYPEIKGSIFYRGSSIQGNNQGCKDKISDFYIRNYKTFYVDIYSFLGEEAAKNVLNRVQNDTGWYLEYQQMDAKEPLYKVETGGFIGEDSVNSAINTLKQSTGLEGKVNFTGNYSGGSKTPIYRLETGSIIGEENVIEAMKRVQEATGWWLTYEPKSAPNEYKIVTGGFVGEENAKNALKTLQDITGWWATYVATGGYVEEAGVPIYSIVLDGYISEKDALDALKRMQQATGWWAYSQFTGEYIHYYRVVTGGIVGLTNAREKSNFIAQNYGWYHEIKEK